MWLILGLIFILNAGVLLIIYLKNCNKYWKIRGVPFSPPRLLFGNLQDFVFGKRHIAFIFNDIYKSFTNEKFIGVYDFTKPNLIVKDTELIGIMLKKDFNHFQDRNKESPSKYDLLAHHIVNLKGNRWKTARSKLMPTFSMSKLKLMYSMMCDCVDNLDSNLSKFTDTSEAVDVREMMARFATDVIGRCAFGLNFNTLDDPHSEYRKVGKRMFEINLSDFIKVLIRLICPQVLSMLKIKSTPQSVENFFFNLMQNAAQQREQETVSRNDFLQLMLNIRDKEIQTENEHSNFVFDDSAIASSMLIFYLAGFETTATTLSYCLYELALNPHIQEKVRLEIKSVADSYDGIFSYETLKDLIYTNMVIEEVLRKYNPAPFTGRVCNETYQIPGTTVILKPGDRITIPIYSIHHDEKFYPNPEKFDPLRFTEENKCERPPNTYLPFGDGPRICIGLQFAKLEMKCCLCSILLKYKFAPCEKTEIPIEINTRSFLYTPKRGIWLSVAKIT